MKTSNTIFTKACMVLAATALVNVGCTDDFLETGPFVVLQSRKYLHNRIWFAISLGYV